MRKIITLLASFLICSSITAQVNASQTINGIMKKAINDKKIMSGDEALGHLLINPNPSTTANLKTATSTETLIGTTTYDLQSNAAVHATRILMNDDGSMAGGWSMSQQYNTTYSDRGTGYNFYNTSGNWDAQPTTRLETSRGGWPSILVCGNGTESAITHNTDNSWIQRTFRASYGSGLWEEDIVSSQDSMGTYSYLIWNRSAIGGIDNNTIHMIAVTASSAFQGTPFNGLDGALVYYRSQDCGSTWDRKDIQLPTLDTSMFNSMAGDVYAIDAQGETVVIAYFNDWGDSFILKSNDNGDTWTRTTFLDFPVDKYVMDSGLDLDGDLEMDMVYSTDNSGAVILDANNEAHVFVGNMAYIDDDLADGASSWFPATNGLLYWNESMGPDLTPPTVQDSSLWYSDHMPVIAQAPDLNGDSIVAGVDSVGGYALYYASRSSMPSAGISANGEIYVSFSGYTENADDGTQVFRHIYITKSSDGGLTWRNPVDVTPHDVWAGMQECVFGAMHQIVDDKIRIIYQKDFQPGLAVRGDEDMVDMNDIVYLEIDTVGLFDATPLSNNNLDKEFEFSIYPNPANNTTTIQISSKINERARISIVDMLGKTVYSTEKDLLVGLNTENINTSKLKTGIYFVNALCENKKISKKLVITR